MSITSAISAMNITSTMNVMNITITISSMNIMILFNEYPDILTTKIACSFAERLQIINVAGILTVALIG